MDGEGRNLVHSAPRLRTLALRVAVLVAVLGAAVVAVLLGHRAPTPCGSG
jgi:hypothetical protein